MKNARFWTGLVFCAGLPMTLVMGTTTDYTQYSLVEGSVTYNGRPVTDGLVMFQSLDRVRSPDILAIIDPSGHFRGRAEWPLYPPGRVQFRMHVLPDPRDRGDAQAAAHAGQSVSAPAVVSRPPDSVPTPDMSGMSRVVPSWHGGPITPSAAGPPAPVVGATKIIPARWLPEIWLAPEPTRIAIDLKD